MNVIKKYKYWIIGGLIVLIGLVAFGLSQTNSSNAAETEIGETAVAFIGDLSESATASGQVEAQRQASLSLAASGLVDNVAVDIGDGVQADDLLVQLENEALLRAVTSAEQDIAIAEADLAKLISDPTAEELASAEAAVLSAQIKLDSLLSGATEDEIAASEAGVKAAQANMWSASGNVQAAQTVSDADILAAEGDLADALEAQQAVHDVWVDLAECEENADGSHTCTPKVDSEKMDTATEDVQVANAQVAIAQAKLDELRDPDANSVASSQAGWSSASAQYDATVARHDALLEDASDAEIAAAEADLAGAKAALDNLLSGPSDSELKIYETRLAQAQTSLQEALNALDDAQLSAPFDGVITAVHVSRGEQASGLAVEIMDNRNLEVILNVDEIDVGQLALGQQAVVTMETWPDDELMSEITAISPSAADNSSGVVFYDVHLSLDESDLPILVGMTANADLLTDSREDVLLVPNAALTADREEGTYTVNLVRTAEDGSTSVTPVEVTIGLKDNQFTQITSGILEGDELLIGELAAPVDTDTGPGGPFAR